MSASAADVHTDPAQPGVLLFEGPTAEAALEAVHEQLGAGAEILSAERVTRGGLGGFFAREIVQIQVREPAATADRRPAAPAADAEPLTEAGTSRAADGPAPQPTALDDLLATLIADAGEEERSFAEVLRGRMPELAAATEATDELAAVHAPAQAAPAAPAAPAAEVALAEPVGPPAPVAAASAAPLRAPSLTEPEATSGGVDWSIANLQRLGLPASILDGVRGLDPRDDVAWVAGLARAVTTVTRPLPSGCPVYAGPRAARLARGLDVPVVAVGNEPEGGRPFAVAMQGGEPARSWLAWGRGQRWLHVVAGGEGWRPLLFDEPLAVSWVGEEHLCEAVRLCAELGLVLGYGLGGGRGARAQRATPLEVAMAIRAQLPVR